MYPVNSSIIYSGIINSGDDESNLTPLDQLKTQPAIDDVICHYFDGTPLKEALFIIDNIRENKMKIKWFSVNVWSVRYKRKHVCNLRILSDSLSIGPISDIIDANVKTAPNDLESMKHKINALRDSMTFTQEPIHALR